jgi:D-beta-D-heptose 7-phosphate kinase/D-beta-D-heptose 1-phosphate adenosyltransferase
MMHIDISKFNDCHVLVVGDLMIDAYVWGEVDRISPEAPVQVVTVQTEDYTLGGAGNVVNNLVALGAKVSVIGVTGTGRDGKLLLQMFNALGVDTSGVIQDPNRPTTRKTRVIAANQHVLRIDRETRKEIAKGTFDALKRSIESKVPETDVILISDYGKGVITPSLLSGLFANAKMHAKITIADPKGIDFSKYSGVSLLTPNKKEVGLAAGLDIVDESTFFEAGKRILETVGIDKLLITCGKDGMLFFGRKHAPYKIRAKARQVFDVSGAGDTVLAVLGLAVASGASFAEGAILANTAAGIVVGKVGTATVSGKELEAALTPNSDDVALKYRRLSEIPELIQELKRKGQRVVLTNGCFDLLHAGHIKLFSASKQMGDVLIVAIDDDDSVSSLKGPGRPVISAKERVRILSALESVDYVVVFSTDELSKIIETIKPDVLTKGSNYKSDEVFGREVVEAYGGQVVLMPVTENISSTRIIDSIKNG